MVCFCAASARRRRARIDALSPRQREVLLLMAEGNLNKQIGYSLGLSERTVKMHRAALLKALGVATTADAICVAVEAGFDDHKGRLHQRRYRLSAAIVQTAAR